MAEINVSGIIEIDIEGAMRKLSAFQKRLDETVSGYRDSLSRIKNLSADISNLKIDVSILGTGSIDQFMNKLKEASKANINTGQLIKSIEAVNKIAEKLDASKIQALGENLNKLGGNLSSFRSSTGSILPDLANLNKELQVTKEEAGAAASSLNKLVRSVASWKLIKEKALEFRFDQDSISKATQKIESFTKNASEKISVLSNRLRTLGTELNKDVVLKYARNIEKFSAKTRIASDDTRQWAVDIRSVNTILGVLGFSTFSQEVKGIAKAMVEATAKTEEYKSSLLAVTKSLSMTESLFKKFQQYSIQTPFQLKDVMEGGVKLEAVTKKMVGFKMSTEEALALAGDLSMTFGKDLQTGVDAVAKALSGSAEAVEMMRNNFGVTRPDLERFGVALNNQGGVLLRTSGEIKNFILAIKGIQKEVSGLQAVDFRKDNLQTALEAINDNLFKFYNALGTSVLPILKEFVKLINYVIEAFSALPGPIKAVIASGVLLTSTIFIFSEKLAGLAVIMASVIAVIKAKAEADKEAAAAAALHAEAEVAKQAAMESGVAATAAAGATAGVAGAAGAAGVAGAAGAAGAAEAAGAAASSTTAQTIGTTAVAAAEVSLLQRLFPTVHRIFEKLGSAVQTSWKKVGDILVKGTSHSVTIFSGAVGGFMAGIGSKLGGLGGKLSGLGSAAGGTLGGIAGGILTAIGGASGIATIATYIVGAIGITALLAAVFAALGIVKIKLDSNRQIKEADRNVKEVLEQRFRGKEFGFELAREEIAKGQKAITPSNMREFKVEEVRKRLIDLQILEESMARKGESRMNPQEKQDYQNLKNALATTRQNLNILTGRDKSQQAELTEAHFREILREAEARAEIAKLKGVGETETLVQEIKYLREQRDLIAEQVAKSQDKKSLQDINLAILKKELEYQNRLAELHREEVALAIARNEASEIEVSVEKKIALLQQEIAAETDANTIARKTIELNKLQNIELKRQKMEILEIQKAAKRAEQDFVTPWQRQLDLREKIKRKSGEDGYKGSAQEASDKKRLKQLQDEFKILNAKADLAKKQALEYEQSITDKQTGKITAAPGSKEYAELQRRREAYQKANTAAAEVGNKLKQTRRRLNENTGLPGYENSLEKKRDTLEEAEVARDVRLAMRAGATEVIKATQNEWSVKVREAKLASLQLHNIINDNKTVEMIAIEEKKKIYREYYNFLVNSAKEYADSVLNYNKSVLDNQEAILNMREKRGQDVSGDRIQIAQDRFKEESTRIKMESAARIREYMNEQASLTGPGGEIKDPQRYADLTKLIQLEKEALKVRLEGAEIAKDSAIFDLEMKKKERDLNNQKAEMELARDRLRYKQDILHEGIINGDPAANEFDLRQTIADLYKAEAAILDIRRQEIEMTKDGAEKEAALNALKFEQVRLTQEAVKNYVNINAEIRKNKAEQEKKRAEDRKKAGEFTLGGHYSSYDEMMQAEKARNEAAMKAREERIQAEEEKKARMRDQFIAESMFGMKTIRPGDKVLNPGVSIPTFLPWMRNDRPLEQQNMTESARKTSKWNWTKKDGKWIATEKSVSDAVQASISPFTKTPTSGIARGADRYLSGKLREISDNKLKEVVEHNLNIKLTLDGKTYKERVNLTGTQQKPAFNENVKRGGK